MNITYCKTSEDLGKQAAQLATQIINRAIAKQGEANIILSTGASQFTTLSALVQSDIDWAKVNMFHLDEYVNMDDTHPASFVKYLKERFVSHVSLKNVYYVDTTKGAKEIIAYLNEIISNKTIDLGLIGIGENAHIAFNDPPADFAIDTPYQIVKLALSCRQQQLGEGWFKTLDDVPTEAVSMTVKQIMKCEHIISAVPYAVKAQAIYNTLTAKEVTPEIPATIMKTHQNFNLFIDSDSSKLLNIHY